MLRRAENVSLMYRHPTAGKGRRGKGAQPGFAQLHVGKRVVSSTIMTWPEINAIYAAAQEHPIGYAVGERNYWFFQGRWWSENEGLDSAQVLALIVSRQRRRESELELARATLSDTIDRKTPTAVATADAWNVAPGELPWRNAERAAVPWMQRLGFSDAAATPGTNDGGVDVRSAKAVLQVKMHAKPIHSPDIQKLRGAAFRSGAPLEHAMFLSYSGYSKGAVLTANDIGVALFSLINYVPVPVNSLARDLVQRATEHVTRLAANDGTTVKGRIESPPKRAPTGSTDHSTAGHGRPKVHPPDPDVSPAVRDATERYEAMRMHAAEAAAQAKRWKSGQH